ncbi:uncharacterized protein LOC143823492 [Paroedura picta]|uniref:uncharacterized protein LOC143823492 n=1 Tax=Paroedura picta TaxID=143630 RepID=UPI0040572755
MFLSPSENQLVCQDSHSEGAHEVFPRTQRRGRRPARLQGARRQRLLSPPPRTDPYAARLRKRLVRTARSTWPGPKAARAGRPPSGAETGRRGGGSPRGLGITWAGGSASDGAPLPDVQRHGAQGALVGRRGGAHGGRPGSRVGPGASAALQPACRRSVGVSRSRPPLCCFSSSSSSGLAGGGPSKPRGGAALGPPHLFMAPLAGRAVGARPREGPAGRASGAPGGGECRQSTRPSPDVRPSARRHGLPPRLASFQGERAWTGGGDPSLRSSYLISRNFQWTQCLRMTQQQTQKTTRRALLDQTRGSISSSNLSHTMAHQFLLALGCRG